MNNQRLLRIAAWGLIVAIFVVTIAPAGLRPSLGIGMNKERAIAFAVLALVFALAYPRRILVVFASLALAAVAFELLQSRRIGRHPSEIDVMFKVAGTVAGTLFGAAINAVIRRKPPL